MEFVTFPCRPQIGYTPCLKMMSTEKKFTLQKKMNRSFSNIQVSYFQDMYLDFVSDLTDV